MRELNEKEIESVSGALAQDAAPPKQNTEAIQSAQNKSTLTPFIAVCSDGFCGSEDVPWNP